MNEVVLRQDPLTVFLRAEIINLFLCKRQCLDDLSNWKFKETGVRSLSS